jgi:aminoglycoside phosphotransferase (APT) family kinase protein
MIYGTEDPTIPAQRLPFGLFLKCRGDADMVRNEFNALQRVHRETSIPAPEPLDVIPKGGKSYLLTTRVPGAPLWLCQGLLSDADCDEIVAQLKSYVAQLRDLPKTVNPEMAICNTLGEPCRDHRIWSADPIGPFADEAAFSQCLRFSDEPSRRGHKMVFTHADLNPRNILVDQVALPDGSSGWRVTGIVDWETAGYYPEYWDYTKALFEGFRWRPRYLKMVHSVFAEFGDYSREYDVEKRAWESGDGI